MESLPSLHHKLLHLSHPPRSTPFSSLSFLSLPPPPPPPSSSSSSSTRFRLSPLTASHSPNNNHSSTLSPFFKTLNPFFSPLLKTTCIAAAFFLMRLHLNPRPALAAQPPFPPQPQAATATPTPEDSTPENLSNEENNSDGNSVEELQSLVETKIRERKFDEAIQVIDRLNELEPEELDWRLLKAQMCARKGEHVSARDSFEEVLKRDPFNVEALHGLLLATSELEEPTKDLLPRFEEAVRFFEKEKKDSDMRDSKLLIAQVMVLEGDLSGALKVYEELAEQEPKDFRLYLCQGVVYTMMKKSDEARRQFEKFRELIPEDHPYRDYFEFEDNRDAFLQKLDMEAMTVIGKR